MGRATEAEFAAMLAKLVDAVVDAVHECGGPAPESMIHIAFETRGIPSHVTRVVIDSAIKTGKIRRAHSALWPNPPAP